LLFKSWLLKLVGGLLPFIFLGIAFWVLGMREVVFGWGLVVVAIVLLVYDSPTVVRIFTKRGRVVLGRVHILRATLLSLVSLGALLRGLAIILSWPPMLTWAARVMLWSGIVFYIIIELLAGRERRGVS
jgi:hypothetical protein